jgi:hypothetical protein
MSTNNSTIDQFDVEPQKLSICEKDEDSSSTEIKLDQHGFPLVPQPSQFKDDPLVSGLDFVFLPQLPTDPFLSFPSIRVSHTS